MKLFDAGPEEPRGVSKDMRGLLLPHKPEVLSTLNEVLENPTGESLHCFVRSNPILPIPCRNGHLCDHGPRACGGRVPSRCLNDGPCVWPSFMLPRSWSKTFDLIMLDL